MTHKFLLPILCSLFLFPSVLLAQDTLQVKTDTLTAPVPAATIPTAAETKGQDELRATITSLESQLTEREEQLDASQRMLHETEEQLRDTRNRLTETKRELREREEQTDDPAYRHDDRRRHRRHGSEIRTFGGRNDNHSGGFGAVTFKASDYLDESLIMMGLRGGWIINRSFAIGLEAHGIIPTTNISGIINNDEVVVLGGYGGVFIEPILLSNQIVHVTFPISAGAGWLGYEESFQSIGDRFTGLVDDDVFWYVEPGANLEFNVSRGFRLNLGLSRRFTKDLALVQGSDDDFSNMSYFFGMKFGRF